MARGGITGAAQYGFTSRGGLVYVPGTGGDLVRSLVWVDRNGTEEPVSERRGMFGAARLSPDGRRIAVEVTVQGAGRVWILGIEDDSFAPLNNEGTSAGPLWTPDSQTVLFYWDDREGAVRGPQRRGGIYKRDASFGSEREEILQTDGGTFPISWSGDGEDLVLHEMIEGQQRRRILVVPFVGEDRTAFAPLDPSGQFNQRSPMVSPDGRWVAYVSTQSGRDEVYLQSYPDPLIRKRQVSTTGGSAWTWTKGGREFIYRQGDSVMAVPVNQETGNTGRPVLLFRGEYGNGDVTADGERFLLIKTPNVQRPRRVEIVLNWLDELQREVP